MRTFATAGLALALGLTTAASAQERLTLGTLLPHHNLALDENSESDKITE